MRHLGLTISAAALALALAGCGKSPSNNQADQSQATSTEQSTTASGTTSAGPSDEQKHEILEHMPAPYNKADLDNGEAKFAVCKSCHTLNPGGPDMTGPNLNGVFGRKVASKAGFKYSDALAGQSFTWDEAQMDKWLTDPKVMVPGTKMTFPGFKDAKDRTDVIAYVKVNTSPAP